MHIDHAEIERRFGVRVREVRSAAGLSQAALADALAEAGGPRLNHSTIAKVERGTRGVGLGEAVLIAQVLGVTVESMLGEDGAALLALVQAEREAQEAAAANAAAQERLRALGVRVVGAQPMSEAERQAAADQADEIESVGGEIEYRRLLDEQSEG